MKLAMTKIAAGLVMAAAATSALAVPVSSFTIEEVGGVSTMTAATAGTGGGIFYFGAETGNGVFTPGNKNWVSAGSIDGAMLADGVPQLNNEFTLGFTYGGPFQFNPNTVNGGVTASWTGVDGAGQVTIDLSGFGGQWAATGKNYVLFPDPGTLVSDVQTVGGVSYYTLDWSHTITLEEDVDFAGQRADWHMEGIMTPVPEASTYGMMLAGLGLVGGMVARRRKFIA